MSDQEIKTAFDEYRKRMDRQALIGELTKRGLSPSFAERAANGKWHTRRIQNRTRNVILGLLGLKKAS